MSQIKQLQPKEGVTLLSWLTPDDFREFAGLVGDHLYYWGKLHTRADYPYSVKLPFSDVEYLGKATEIPEEVWQGIVDRMGPYKNYLLSDDEFEDYSFKTATESAMSFLEANEVYSVNPLNPPIERLQYGGGYAMRQSEVDEYEKAEANTGTWLILIPQD